MAQTHVCVILPPCCPHRPKPRGLETTLRLAGRSDCRCFSAVLQWEHLEHGDQAGASRAHLGQCSRERSHRPAVSSGEPRGSGSSLILFNAHLTGGRVGVAGVCMARGEEKGRFQGMHMASSPGGGAGLATYKKDRCPVGRVLRGGSISEFCQSAGPEVARTV